MCKSLFKVSSRINILTPSLFSSILMFIAFIIEWIEYGWILIIVFCCVHIYVLTLYLFIQWTPTYLFHSFLVFFLHCKYSAPRSNKKPERKKKRIEKVLVQTTTKNSNNKHKETFWNKFWTWKEIKHKNTKWNSIANQFPFMF